MRAEGSTALACKWKRKRPVTGVNGAARLVIVDDHALTRAGLREVLADEPSVEVIGEASNGREALELCSRVRPELVLMDVRMPEMDGLVATREIKRRHPQISVLLLSIHDNPDYLLEALKAGAAGYVLKEADQEELVSALQRVLSGGWPLDPDLAAELLLRLAEELEVQGVREEEAGGEPPAPPPLQPLTPREVEVLGLLAQGNTNHKLAQVLVISPGTVKRHVENIIAKLGVSDRTQAAVRAYKLGLITSSSR
jgi:DNA-binding NarL/FixJ family response regulator